MKYAMRLRTSRVRSNSGQALVETVIITPLLLCLVLNAVNFAYFLLMAINLASAPHHASLYNILGSSAPQGASLPPAAPASGGSTAAPFTVSYLTYQDLTGAISSPGTVKVQVCSAVLGTNGSGSTQTAKCMNCTSSGVACVNGSLAGQTPDSDPEAPAFVLNRVDVAYTFTPMIPGLVFGVALLPTPACSLVNGQISCTIHRQVSMRAMGS
jgi:Flp pilus assembly protein TadG